MTTEPPTDDDPNGPRDTTGTPASPGAADSGSAPGAAGPPGSADAAEGSAAEGGPSGPSGGRAPDAAAGRRPTDASEGRGAHDASGDPGPADRSGAAADGSPGGGRAGGPRAGTDGPGDPDAHRPRRARGVVGGVVAAVVLVAGGGAYLAATASGGDGGASPGDGGGSAPPALALDGYGAAGRAGIAVGEPNPYGAVYRASGELPEGPDTAPVYWAKGRVSEEDVARLAKALDLTGSPRPVAGHWQVGNGKGGAEPLLRVDREAPGTWTFSALKPGGDDCARGRPCKPGGAGSFDPAATDPVGEAAARKAAAPVLEALGQDDAKLDAHQVLGGARVVNAEPRVGGLPTSGWTTGLQIGAGGEVLGGSGRLTAPVEGAEYPVIGAGKALDLMNGAPASSGRKGIGGCASPVPLKDRDEKPCSAPGTAGARPTVRVERAEFGLAARTSAGRPVLVPSWLFQVRPAGEKETSTVAHPAIDPAHLTGPEAPGSPTPSASSSPAREARVTGHRARGTDLTVVYEGGVCTDYAASAREDAKKVTVTVRGTTAHPERPCLAVARVYRATVHLDAPLGDRAVVDSRGEAVPRATAPLPATSPSR
ncbi:hypothetical protein [Streptomyces sp. MH191]|uniref:hypothetical protein n=2 Tax=unclassified Streptomyces TaxID=2593676 RepID=UPI0032DBA360